VSKAVTVAAGSRNDRDGAKPEEKPLRKTRLILSVPLAVGAIGLAAPAAIADPTGLNYGHCVAAGLDPNTSVEGPFSDNPNTPTGHTGAPNAQVHSDGRSHFSEGLICAKGV
jgi:hypothetical protein